MEKELILKRSWFMLFIRLFLFATIQGAFALVFVLLGKENAWTASANWWPFVVGFANLVCLFLLIRFFRTEGSNYWEIFRIKKENIGKDLLTILGALVISAPLSYFPNVILGKLLFGDANATLELFIRPLPMWAVYVSIVFFPITQGLVEIPTYMLYVLPRLEKNGYQRWLAVLLPTLLLSAQHIAVPLLFNGRFIIWRLFMFLPFALFMALLIRWRPRLMPYIAIVHALMDAATAIMLIPFGY